MASEKKHLTIGTYQYVLSHAPASTALRAAATLANGLAPLVNGFRRGKGGDWDKALLGVAEAFANPDLANHLESLCKAFAPYTQVVWTGDGGQTFSRDLGGDFFESHFAGKFDALITWLRAAVEYDLGGFLDEIKAKIALAKAAAESADKKVSASESPSAAPKTG